MIKYLTLLVAVGVVFVGRPADAASITLDYSNVTNASIVFATNSTFSFSSNGSGDDFQITGSTGTGDSIGFLGDITGTYTVGAITTTATPLGNVQTASVSGSGTVTIDDGSNLFTATLDWVSISQLGTGSNLNVTGVSNLTNISYSGTSSDLLTLLNGTGQTQVLTFNFVPAIALSTLVTQGGTTSYSGNFIAQPAGVVPEPTSMLLLGTGLFGAAVAARRRRAARRKS